MKIGIVIPCYNEKKRLPSTLRRLIDFLSSNNYDYHVLVVNNGSVDGTQDFLLNLKHQNVSFVDTNKNTGKGDAVARGMLHLRDFDYILFADADNATDISNIESFLPYFNEGYDIVIGSRYLKDSKIVRPQNILKVLLSRMGNLFINVWLGFSYRDTQCGFKAFKKETVDGLFGNLKNHEWSFDVELLYRAKKFGYKVAEVPVSWKNDLRSKVVWNTYLIFLKDVFFMRWQIDV